VAVTASTAIALVFLYRLLEVPEALGPQLGEKIANGFDALGPHRVQASLSVRADGHEPGFPKHLEVLRDGLLGDVEVPGDLVDRLRFVANEHQDGSAPGIRQSSQRSFGVHHEKLISIRGLYKYTLV
jgi:hypothetical protein